MPKVSIIIPVYNSEQYICECLDSAVNQTLKDIEIICVDDCSTDLSKILLEKYAETDERIKIMYNNENKGQAFSRNRAIEAAKGEYIQFLDSDDYLNSEDVLEKLYFLAVENNLDLLKSEYILQQKEMPIRHIQYPNRIIKKIYSGQDLLYELESHNMNAWTLVSNFVSLNYIKETKIKFYDGIIHEDVLYSYDLYYYAEKAMCVDLCTYVYTKHDNTTTTKPKGTSNLKGYLVCAHEILKKDFMNSSIEFRYATIKYFLQMHQNMLGIIKSTNCNLLPELFDVELIKLYEMFWAKDHNRYINSIEVIQNINIIAQSEKLYLYGAGKAAKEMLDILVKYDIAIDGVFVTNTENSTKTFFGHKVMCIDSCRESEKKALFLVAITKKYVGETLELLYSKGIENVIYVC